MGAAPPLDQFGLWVAGLRALLSEGQQRPAAYAAPFYPLHKSAGVALRLAAPRNASRYERLRDKSLLALDMYMKTRTFLVLTVVWLLAVVVFGVLFFFLLIGVHGFDDLVDPLSGNVTATGQDRANDLGNVSIQILTALFSYITLLTLPWRVANAAHLWCSHRSSEAGLDFYGRPTKSIWFHIPPRQRKRVVFLLVGNAVMQYATQLCRLIWSSYPASQTPAGAFFINITFIASILCGASSGGMQGSAENGVREANPGDFPPTPIDVWLETWRAERQRIRQEMRERATTQVAVRLEAGEGPAAPPPAPRPSGPSANPAKAAPSQLEITSQSEADEGSPERQSSPELSAGEPEEIQEPTYIGEGASPARRLSKQMSDLI